MFDRIVLPLVVAVLGGYVLFTAVKAVRTGQIAPIIRGASWEFSREHQPRRFCASLIWNLLLSTLFIWLAWQVRADANERHLIDTCYDEANIQSPHAIVEACTTLIASDKHSEDSESDYFGSRGIAYYNLGYYERAVHDYSSALQLEPAQSYLYFNRALAFRKMSRRAAFMADLDMAIKTEPSDPDAYLERGLAHLDAGELAAAIADFTRVIKFKPNDAMPLANRGIAYAWKNDRLLADADFQAARTIDPSNQVVMRGAVVLAMQSGDAKATLARLDEALARDPHDAWSRSTREEFNRRLQAPMASQENAEGVGVERTD